MQLHVIGRHVEVPEGVRSYLESKIPHLTKFYDRIHDIEVVFSNESEQFTAEMIVRADRKHTFVASETGPDTMTLIDLVLEKIERQLIKHKEKNRNKKGGRAADGGSGSE